MTSSTLIKDYLGYGLHADRPVTPPVTAPATALYYETDTDNTFVWDGSAWAQVNGGLASIADGDLLANISGSSAPPIANTVSGVLDHVFSNSQGSILYRDATGWAALAPGTSGNFLKTQGASANPVWAATGLSPIADGDVLANISGASAAPIGNTLSGVIDHAIGSTQGDILYRNATGWVVLPPGTAGQVLQTGGASANPSWANAAGSSWTLAASWAFSTNVTHVDFTGITGFQDVMVLLRNVTTDASVQRIVQLSADGGTTFNDITLNIDSNGVESTAPNTGVDGTASTAAHSGIMVINAWGLAQIKLCYVPNRSLTRFCTTLSAMNAIRVTSTTGTANFTGGSIQVFAR